MNDYRVIRFTAPWCGPCRQYGPIFDEVAGENTNPKIKYETIDIDKNETAQTFYMLRGIPTVLVLQNDREVGRIVGFREKEYLKNTIDGLVKKSWRE